MGFTSETTSAGATNDISCIAGRLAHSPGDWTCNGGARDDGEGADDDFCGSHCLLDRSAWLIDERA